MEIVLSNSSDKPIYEQIAAQIRDAVAAGELAAGEQLPSIRALAAQLRISAITTKRAYQDLEAQGYVTTIPGKGCFVAERSTELLREENLRRIEEHMREISALAVQSGLTRQELSEMYTLISEEELT